MEKRGKNRRIVGYRLSLLGVVFLLVFGCSRKEDKWVNRNFHTMATYYNILYNGNLVLEKGVEGLIDDNADDYWKILPVEQILNRQEPVEFGQMVQIDNWDLPLRFSDQRPQLHMDRPDPTQPQDNTKPETEETPFPQPGNRRGLEPNQAGRDSIQGYFADQRVGDPIHRPQNQGQPNLPGRNNTVPNRPGQPGYGNNQNYGYNQPYGQGQNFNPARNQQIGNQQSGDLGRYRDGRVKYRPGDNSGIVQSGGYQPLGGGQMGNSYGNYQGGQNQGYGAYGNTGGGYPAQNYGGAAQQNYGNQGYAGGAYGRGNSYGSGYGNQNSYGGGGYGQMGAYNNQGGIPGRNSRNPSLSTPESYRIGNFYDETRPFQGIISSEAFPLAEEKATKAIQNHSMVIKNEEKNRLIGDAYYLLGKARYYDQRYFPALDVFNYIMSHFYEDGALISSAEIWREKIYLKLENNERVARNIPAILKGEPARDSVRFANTLKMSGGAFWSDTTDIVGELLKSRVEEKLAVARNISFHTKEDITEATSALAQAYLNLGNKEKAIEALNIAIGNTRDVGKRGRFLFIKGQIFERLQQIDSANAAFDEVIALNRRIPRDYLIQAHLGKIRHFDPIDTDAQKQMSYIDRLLDDRENRPYLDLLHYHAGQYYLLADSTDLAIQHLKESVRYDFWDPGLKARAYTALADHNFKKAAYKMAAAYYDSTLVNLPVLSKEYRETRKKRVNLNDVIIYESVSERNDSILRLVKMTPEERGLFFKNYTDSLKILAIEQAEKQIRQDRKLRRNKNIFGKQKSELVATNVEGSFYFYDPRQVASGKAVFRQIWGDRGLRDNWRTENRRGEEMLLQPLADETEGDNAEERDILAEVEANPNFNPQTYLDWIPQNPQVIDSIVEERNFVNYQLGILYHEKFKENRLAAKRLEEVLRSNPEERLVLPAKYNLYRIYEELGELAHAESLRKDIIENHKDSRYALALTNPEKLRENTRNPDRVYEALYRKYNAQEFEKVITEIDDYIVDFEGEAIVAKMELLRAMAIGRLYGVDAYEQALNYVALNYPQREEGVKAGQLLMESIPQLKNAEIVMDLNGWHNLIYPFAKKDRKEAEVLKRELDRAIKEFEMEDAKTSIDVYDPETIFLVISGLHNRILAEDFGDKLEREKDYKITHEHFGISSENYKTLLFHKNLEEYLQVFKF